MEQQKAKRQQIEKLQNYGKYVKEMYWPKVSTDKQQSDDAGDSDNEDNDEDSEAGEGKEKKGVDANKSATITKKRHVSRVRQVRTCCSSSKAAWITWFTAWVSALRVLKRVSWYRTRVFW